MTLTYLVIGANRGLGLEFVKQISARGDKVLATARDLKAATELTKLAEGKDVQLFEADFTDAAQLKTLASKVPPFNRLIVNAGVAKGAQQLLDESADDTPEALLSMLDVNVVGPVKTVRALLPALKKGSGDKKILLMGSILGSVAAVDQLGSSAGGYSVSKSALNMVGRKMSVELKDSGISVMIMHPGWVKTDMGTDKAPVEKADSIAGMLKVFEEAESGTYRDFEGKNLSW